MVGYTDSVQTPLSGHGNDLIQIDEAVQGMGALMQMHIYQHGSSS